MSLFLSLHLTPPPYPSSLVHSGVPGSPSHSLGTSSALMMVLEGCTATKHHLLIADTLMQLKRDVCTVRQLHFTPFLHTLSHSHSHTHTLYTSPYSSQDLLSIIAYGTPNVRQKALNLLLHYWPIPQKLSTSSTYRGVPLSSNILASFSDLLGFSPSSLQRIGNCCIA